MPGNFTRRASSTRLFRSWGRVARQPDGYSPADVFVRTPVFRGRVRPGRKHLAVLGDANADAATGSLLYRAALAAERSRNGLFEKGDYPGRPADSPPIRGSFNGQPFESIEDSDARIGPRLEIFGAGDLMWLPLAHIASIEMEAPKRLRDLLWIPALVKTGPAFKGTELGQVLIPALSPFSFKHSDPAVRLGRATVWEEPEPDKLVPYGQKDVVGGRRRFPASRGAQPGDRRRRTIPRSPCLCAMTY